jgi:Archaeal fructose-1,6-bisphosphatase and related enzymes of inositol monophosphatase family
MLITDRWRSLNDLVVKVFRFEGLGSAAIDLCWVAAGRFDGFYEHKLEPWDSAAGYLMVEEAGGKVTDHEGEKFSVYQHKILATNGKIHEEMLAVMHGVKVLS